jgi:hypothetical protein
LAVVLTRLAEFARGESLDRGKRLGLADQTARLAEQILEAADRALVYWHSKPASQTLNGT